MVLGRVAVMGLCVFGASVPLAHAAEAGLSTGRYGLFVRAATQAHLPVLGERPGASEAWVLLELSSGDGGRLTAHHHPCEIEMRGAGARAKVRLSDGFVEAMGVRETHFVLTPAADRFGVVVDMGVHHIGYDPEVSDGVLPRDSAHAAVIDHEGDTRPGATVLIDIPLFGEEEIYLVQRAHTSLTGSIWPDGVGEGQVVSHALEQHTIGSTNPLLRLSPRMRPDEENSRWWMVPVPEGTTCDDLRGAACRHPQSGSDCVRALDERVE